MVPVFLLGKPIVYSNSTASPRLGLKGAHGKRPPDVNYILIIKNVLFMHSDSDRWREDMG